MNRLSRIPPSADLPLLLLFSVLIKGLGIYFLPAVNPDGIRYINAAREFLAGDFSLGLSYVGNLAAYPLLLAGTRQILPDWVLAGQFLSLLGFSLAAIPVYLITRDLFGRTAAVWSGFAFVASPVINSYAAEILREPLSIGLLLWVARLGQLSLRSKRPAHVLAASALALLAASFRLESALFLPAFLFALLSGGHGEWKRRSLLLVPALAPWVLLAGLLVAGGGLDAVFGGANGVGILASEAGKGNLLGVYPEVYAAFKEFERTLPNANWSNDAAEIARHYLPLIYLVGLFEALVSSLYLPFFLLVLFGLLRPPARAPEGRWPLLLATVFFAGAYFTLLHRNFISPRYLLAPAVLLFPWAGAGVESLRLSLGEGNNRRRLFFLICLAVLLSPFFGLAGQWREDGRVLKEAGIWLKNANDLENIRLICNDERVPFYAGLWRSEYAIMPGGEEDLAGYAAAERADFIVLESSARTAISDPPDGFDLLRKFADAKNRVTIYRRHP